MPAEQVHLTVQFIGDTPASRLDEVIETVRRAGGGIGTFALRPLRLVTLPERGPARLVAAEADAPSPLLELQRRLAARLAHRARGRPGDRFRPHLTLCRFRSPAAMRALDRPLELDPFPVARAVLMKSTLRPEGAEHAEVAALELGAPARTRDPSGPGSP